jgi:hypothetical protein
MFRVRMKPRVNNAIAVREAFAELRAEIVGLFRKLWANPELPGFEVSSGEFWNATWLE